ncbi:hypothetical protein KY336_02995 [Candidatus Woesearchaeota archaeon]|nr:hypothetical protein [Candidatus Woesearchaeota archaeon]
MSFLEKLAKDLKRKSKIAMLTVTLSSSIILPACQVVVNSYDNNNSSSYAHTYNSSSYFNLEPQIAENKNKEEKKETAERSKPYTNPLVDRLYQLEYGARRTAQDSKNGISPEILESQLRIADYVARYEDRWTQADVRLLLHKMCGPEYSSLLSSGEKEILQTELQYLAENKQGEERLFIGKKWTDQKFKRLLRIFKDSEFYDRINQHYKQVLANRNYF